MEKALFFEKSQNNKVICHLCNHNCHIGDGGRGICGVRENRDGELFSMVYGRVVAEHIDPIEKKPLFHYKPGSKSFSIATVGCNFQCAHCQNHSISQYPRKKHTDMPGNIRTPEEIVNLAEQSGCHSISYTYVEPTIFYEFAYDCAVLARKRGIDNIFVSNGYMAPEVTRHLAGVLDAINIDIKAFTEKFYNEVCKARLAPVLDNVRLMHELGVWVEITTLIIPGLNDSPEELREIARFIKEISPSMPWHVTAFFPTYRITDRRPTPVASLQMAREIGLAEGLRFVYEGNVPGEGGEDTACPGCGKIQIKRFGMRTISNHLKGGKCSSCGEALEGLW